MGGQSKYRAVKTPRVMPNGQTRYFDSKKEAQRYDELALMLRSGEIRNLKLQPTFTLMESFVDSQGEAHKAITYKADFMYVESASGVTNIEDVKGVRTKEFNMKYKLMADKGYRVTLI